MRQRTVDELPAPAPDSHLVQMCQHFCFCHSRPHPENRACQSCERAAANKRMDDDYRARLRRAAS